MNREPAPRPRATSRRHGVALAAAISALALLAAACGGSVTRTITSASGGAGSVLTVSACCGFTSPSYNEFNADAVGLAENWVLLPLAVENYPSLSKFTPSLASSWSAKDGQLTVNLRHGVKWQDGKPVTSKDLYDTVLLQGTDGAPLWSDITNVTDPTPSKVVFTLRAGLPPVLAEDNILTVYTDPASVYGHFATPSLKKDEIAYYNKAATDPTAATAMPQYKAISDVFTKLSALPVKTLIGDGPFELKKITSNEASLVKWQKFYGAKKVHVSTVHYYDEANQEVYPLLTTGVLQFTSVELPAPLLAKWRGTADSHVVANPSSGLVIPFNDAQYPLSNVSVRQALAYLIPRSAAALSAYGSAKGAAGIAEPTPDGIPPNVQRSYLTASQIKQLNRYPLDQAKATSLLRSAGFHKSGNQWITAHGKPFTLTLYSEEGASDVDAAYVTISKALTAFGIKTSVQDVESTTLEGDLEDGSFAAGFSQPGGTNPLGILDEMLGPDENFPGFGTAAGKRGIGFGPTESVPGLGKVNVSETIAKELASTPPGPKMKQLVWDWARLVNKDVPYLWYATKIYQLSYSTKEFGHWPPAKSELWKIMTSNRDDGLVLAIREGYLRPKS